MKTTKYLGTKSPIKPWIIYSLKYVCVYKTHTFLSKKYINKTHTFVRPHNIWLIALNMINSIEWLIAYCGCTKKDVYQTFLPEALQYEKWSLASGGFVEGSINAAMRLSLSLSFRRRGITLMAQVGC